MQVARRRARVDGVLAGPKRRFLHLRGLRKRDIKEMGMDLAPEALRNCPSREGEAGDPMCPCRPEKIPDFRCQNSQILEKIGDPQNDPPKSGFYP